MKAPLNAEQQEAVSAPPGHQLVLAGAGTGKTTVLTARFAWLINHYNASPYSVLAVTFTNRAATEMRERIEDMLARPMSGLWLGTFHSIALRMLRSHTDEAGLRADFQILDRDDQKSLIKRLMKRKGMEDSGLQPKSVVNFISFCKEECRRAADVAGSKMSPTGAPAKPELIELYQAYEELCEQEGLVDFSEMLLRCYELLQRHPEVLADYQHRFAHLLVDEFQDTNELQYKWLRLLAGADAKVMVVGDDDQSIYSWRGARLENMDDFRTNFKDVRLVRLEQNYRSTETILGAANAVIANNSERIGKTLRTDLGRGAPILLGIADTDQAEADFVIEQMLRWQMDESLLYSDCAVLYRSHAQSRLLEQACLTRGIPYKVYGGTPFFSRTEVKTALAYLRLLVAPDSNEAFGRVVNLPPRGIGQTSQQKLRALADQHGISMWAASSPASGASAGVLPKRAQTSLGEFHELINNLREEARSLPLHATAAAVIKEAGLEDYYGGEAGEIGRARLDNLEELINACASHEAEEGQSSLAALAAFLNEVTLLTSAETSKAGGEQSDNALQLMTLHSAKGLEFPVVFLAGVEEGLLPHINSINETGGPEEERRLMYVGITRAKSKLCVSYAKVRQLHGETSRRRPSQFLYEIPDELLHTEGGALVAPTRGYEVELNDDSAPCVELSDDDPRALLNKDVYHNKFGAGRVLAIEGDGERARAQVQFRTDRKWLVLAYANLRLSEEL